MTQTKEVPNQGQRGFSTLEMTIVMLMSLIVAAIAVPSYLRVASYLRSVGDLRSLNGVTAQAKMRAAADFTHARIYVDLNANTFHLETWDKVNACWHTDGDVAQCTGANSPVVSLSQGVTFGAGGEGVGPTPGSANVAQSPKCRRMAAGINGGGQDNNTACIEFNSRGIPVDAGNAPTPFGAIYINDANSIEAITVSATGSIQSWVTGHSCQGQTCWHAQ